MSNIYKEFMQYMENEDKERALSFVLELLNSGKIDIPTLYTEILTPSLNNMNCNVETKGICIWKEHIRSSIIRTILECCYPYVARASKSKTLNNEKVIIVCPSEEYHELGARMVADFFTICGYNSIFVGSNTPQNDFLNAIDVINPKYIAISVSNYYNLVFAKKVISRIREKTLNKDFKIIVGGYAFQENPDLYKEIGADIQANSFKQIESISKGVI